MAQNYTGRDVFIKLLTKNKVVNARKALYFIDTFYHGLFNFIT